MALEPMSMAASFIVGNLILVAKIQMLVCSAWPFAERLRVFLAITLRPASGHSLYPIAAFFRPMALLRSSKMAFENQIPAIFVIKSNS